MSDPLGDMLLEAEQEAGAEREERAIILERLSRLEEKLDNALAQLADLKGMERTEQSRNGRKVYTVMTRDEFDRIKTFEVG